MTDEDATLGGRRACLAERSASSGRIYAVLTLGTAERGRLLRSADVVEGVTARAEGEGACDGWSLTPDKVRADAAAAPLR